MSFSSSRTTSSRFVPGIVGPPMKVSKFVHHLEPYFRVAHRNTLTSPGWLPKLLRPILYMVPFFRASESEVRPYAPLQVR